MIESTQNVFICNICGILKHLHKVAGNSLCNFKVICCISCCKNRTGNSCYLIVLTVAQTDIIRIREEVINSGNQKIVYCSDKVGVAVCGEELIHKCFKVIKACLHKVEVDRTCLHIEDLVSNRAVSELSEKYALCSALSSNNIVVFCNVCPSICRLVNNISVVIECLSDSSLEVLGIAVAVLNVLCSAVCIKIFHSVCCCPVAFID